MVIVFPCRRLARAAPWCAVAWLAIASVGVARAAPQIAAPDLGNRGAAFAERSTVSGERGTWLPAPQRPHPSVARVIVPERDGTSFGSCTLVDVRGDYGLVVTNWHVVCDATDTVTVVFPDGFSSAAKVVATDRTWDLAALAIWKPTATPVPLAAAAPQPGEPLTIAGYGSGSYRAVSAPCSQYVAPGLNQPYEMVELSVAARQGDSGGPILNSRGELAGVLFGAGRGTTSGSYSGRVRAFLASVLPDGSPGGDAMLAAQPTTRGYATPTSATTATEPARVVPTARHEPQQAGPQPSITAPPSAGAPTAVAADAPSASAGEPIPLGEQIETVLAFVGGGLLLVHLLRVLLPAR